MAAQHRQSDQWKPGLYTDKHSFVWELGNSVVELLAPQAGERILDIGCGSGQLTHRIADLGAEVVGMDNSPAMIEEARSSYPDLQFQIGDACDFEFAETFDAVFSNAALHWVKQPDQAAECIARALNPRGRVVAEFGGKGNVPQLIESIQAVCRTMLGNSIPHPWYFPSIADFASLLEQHGLEVTQAALINRPTPLEGDDGLRNWVQMFGNHWLGQIEGRQHNAFFAQLEDIARPKLYRESAWFADYRRLRVVAQKI